jgi:signal transduction histidine kinase
VYHALGIEAALRFLQGEKRASAVAATGDLFGPRGVPLSEDGDLLVNFTGQPSGFDFLPFHQVLSRDFPESAVRDKLVFIGQTAQGRIDADRVSTPLGPVFGVFLQGMLADNLIGGSHLRRQGRLAVVLGCFVLGFLSWLGFERLRPGYLVAGIITSLALLWVMGFAAFTQRGLLVDMIPATLVLLGNAVGAAALNLRRTDDALRSRERHLSQLLESTRVTGGSGTPEELPQLLARLVGSSLGARAVTLHAVHANRSWDWLAPLAAGAPPEATPCDMVAVRAFEEAVVPALLREARAFVATSGHDMPAVAGQRLPPLPLVSMPLQARGRVTGLLHLYGKEPTPVSPGRTYSREDVRLVALLGQQAALLLENSLLLQDLEEKNRQLEDTLKRLQRAQDELVRNEKLSALGTMTSMIVHDLRGPLTAASCWAELLQAPDQSAVDVRSGAETILHELRRINAMVQDVLDFSRGARNLRVEPVTVTALLQDVHERICREFPDRPELIDMEDRSDAAAVAVDREKLGNALLNLLRNGIEASDGAAPVTLAAGVSAAGVVFRVADRGPGIPETLRARLFEPFFTSGKSTGTGLGLAIARKTVQDHGGTIRVEAPPTGGTVFTLVLPLHRPYRAGEEGADGAATPAALS